MEKICLLMQETQEIPIQFLGQEDPLEEEVGTYSRILVWRIPWTEEPGGSMGVTKSRTGLSMHAAATKVRLKLKCVYLIRKMG